MTESTAALQQARPRRTALWVALASVIVWFAAWGLAHQLDAARTDHVARPATGLAALNRTALKRLWPYAAPTHARRRASVHGQAEGVAV